MMAVKGSILFRFTARKLLYEVLPSTRSSNIRPRLLRYGGAGVCRTRPPLRKMMALPFSWAAIQVPPASPSLGNNILPEGKVYTDGGNAAERQCFSSRFEVR